MDRPLCARSFGHTLIGMKRFRASRYAAVAAPRGAVGIVATERGVSHLMLTRRTVRQTEALLRERHPEAEHDPDLLPQLQQDLKDYFAGRPVRFEVPVDLSEMTAFQREVLEACAEVEYGRTVSYADLARRVRRPKAARAVGGALGRNPIPLIIPCHRVVAGDGSLGGFSAEQGVSLKRWLLDLESGGRRSPA